MQRFVKVHSRKLQEKGHPKGAALYMLVVFNAFLLSLLGLSALAIARIERKQNVSSIDTLQARRLALSGIRLAKLQLDRDQNWRTAFQPDVLSSPVTLGNGTLQYKITDETDADLIDDPADGITITAVAEWGSSVWSESVSAVPIQGPPEFFKMGLHSGDNVIIPSGARLRMTGGPVSTNKTLQLDGELLGDAECLSRSGSGLFSGDIETNQAPKALPLNSVFDDYRTQQQATTLPYTGEMRSVVLSPGVNTYGGGINPNGLYYINPGAATFSIIGSRIVGTLLIDGNASIDVAAFLQNARSDFPVLIVRGNLSITLDSKTVELSEASYNANFNPVGAEYLGSSDNDNDDVYPNRIDGFIHVLGSVTTSNSPLLQGCLACTGPAQLFGSVEIRLDDTLFAHPPIGYEELPGNKVRFLPLSWKREPVSP